MFFPKIFSLAILVATATANLHDNCYCVNYNDYDQQLTKLACYSYNAANYKWGPVRYDDGLRVCGAMVNAKIAGNQWESACKTMAEHTAGYTDIDAVRGKC